MFWRKKKARPESPEDLFAALTAAIERNDGRGFAALCEEHQEAIVAAFPRWQKPEGGFAKGDSEAVQSYIQVLGHTAQFFAEALGRPELWDALTGGGENPFTRWDAARDEIGRRLQALDYDGAIAQTRDLLADVQACTGNAADEQEELARGQLGQLLLHRGRVDEAIPELEWTLDRCRARQDLEGVGIYLSALHDADRYAGRPSRWRSRLADHLEARGDTEAAARHRSVGERYPDGEPLLRMVVSAGGRVVELDEVPASVERMEVVFERSRPTLAPAIEWLERGRQRTESGDLEGALPCYVAAADADPLDPQARYQLAYVHMLADRPAQALPLYEETERIAPGWFHSRTWRSMAERQLRGELTHEAVRLVDALQDGGLTAEQRLDVTREPILRWPRVPELHLYRGQALAELGRDDATQAWLAGLEVSEDLPATRSRLLFELGRFEEVLRLNGANLMAQAAATLQLRRRSAT